jgi:RNA polymerase sigma factor (sigma-70 family)
MAKQTTTQQKHHAKPDSCLASLSDSKLPKTAKARTRKLELRTPKQGPSLEEQWEAAAKATDIAIKALPKRDEVSALSREMSELLSRTTLPKIAAALQTEWELLQDLLAARPRDISRIRRKEHLELCKSNAAEVSMDLWHQRPGSRTEVADPSDILKQYMARCLTAPLLTRDGERLLGELMDARRAELTKRMLAMPQVRAWALVEVEAMLAPEPTDPSRTLRIRNAPETTVLMQELVTARDDTCPIEQRDRLAALPWKVPLIREWFQTLERQAETGGLSLHETLQLRGARSAMAEFDEVRNTLVEANLRLAVWFAKRYQGRGLALVDLIQEANTGLLVAADGFDTTTGFKFATYATWWLRQWIQRGICDDSRTVRLPVHAHETAAELQRISCKFMHEQEREPSIEELAEISGVKPNVVKKIAATVGTTSIDVDVPRTESPYSEMLVDPGTVHASDSVNHVARKAQVEKLLEKLKPKERKVLRLRFGFDGGQPMTLEEIASVIGVTRERVRQIQARALGDLKRVLDGSNVTMEDFG